MAGGLLKRIGVAVGVLAAAALFAFIATSKPYVIPSASMSPTLEQGESVIVSRVPYWLGEPEVGDVVVFHPPAGASEGRCGAREVRGQVCREAVPQPSEETFIERIVAGPGDRLSIEEGHPVVNGDRPVEDFAAPCERSPQCDFPKEVEIPPGAYFMMGDNRGASNDSRFWGPVPGDWISGELAATYWPPDRIRIR